mmetsp:Transcript_17901/g.54790  ORF Transcript_17901/g.54790 Transcript_17901/m.54790 type:complete len:263 (-) Transcript_17901:97-885(-)
MAAETSADVTASGDVTGSVSYEQLSVRDLKALLARRGVDAGGALEKSDLVRLARAGEDFDAEARLLFERVNLTPSLKSRYSNLDAIWQHPGTGARVYVGNLETARSRELMAQHGIAAVVNCQGPESENYFEGEEGYHYLRFPIAMWYRQRAEVATEAGVIAYFQRTWDWIDAQLEAERSVLIHCLAGAHRAGTTGTAFLIYAAGMDLNEAIATAKSLRPIINPFGSLIELLQRYAKAMARQRAKHGAAAAAAEEQEQVEDAA